MTSSFLRAATICVCCIALAPSHALADCEPHWDNTIGEGINPYVYAFTLYNGDVIAGGSFTEAGGMAANRVARWDGTAWYPVGSGMNNTVWALTVYNGDLVAAGQFSFAGETQVNRIARWDGEQWLPFDAACPAPWQDGCGMNSPGVTALTVYNGDLIAGGHFTTAGGVAANYIARWDGSGWHPLGEGLNEGQVWDLIVHKGELIVAGTFTAAGRLPVDGIARWDGSSWDALPGLDINVQGLLALTVYEGDLIAAGTREGFCFDPFCAIIGRWDGASWHLLNGLNGLNGQIHALAAYNGELFAGGQQIGPIHPNHGIASWDGVSWDAVGDGDDGIFNTVNALIIYDGKLVIGGELSAVAWNGCVGEPGDLNGDGRVGVPDLLILLEAWGECESTQVPTGECAGFCGGAAPSGCYCDDACNDVGDCCTDVCDGCNELAFCPEPPLPPCPADLNNDGNVGVADLLILLANWG